MGCSSKCSYSKFVAKCPWVIIVVVIVIAAVCTGVMLTQYPFPDFSDPTKGFQVRGSEIKGSALALRNLRNFDLVYTPPIEEEKSGLLFGRRKRQSRVLSRDRSPIKGSVVYNPMMDRHRRQSRVVLPSEWNLIKSARQRRRVLLPTNGSQDCVTPLSPYYPQFVFETTNGENLFSAKALHGICDLEDKVLPKKYDFVPSDCRMHSIASYMSEVLKTPCKNITEEQMAKELVIVEECVDLYYKGVIDKCLDGELVQCLKIPSDCLNYQNAILGIQFLVDKDFLSEASPNNTLLKYTLLSFTSSPSSDTLQKYYLNELAGKDLQNGIVKITGINFGMSFYFDLFSHYLISDMMFFGVAMAIILLVMCVYLRSVVITIVSIITVAFSFIIAYFLYHVVYRLEYFPFMNVLALLLLIGIGADDVFIFYDTWDRVDTENPEMILEKKINLTMRHAALSIFVTSLTTASAFFANTVSGIIAIRLFGIFSGTAILVNFILMITFVPAVIALVEIIYKKCCNNVNLCSCACWESVDYCLNQISIVLFEKTLPFLINKLWFIWILIFLGLGVGGAYLTFVDPQLKLPSSRNFQMFPSSDPLENFIKNQVSKFNVTRREETHYISVEIAWGLKNLDNGNWYNPDDNGYLAFDSSFDMSSKAAQLWMLDFCASLRNQSFVKLDAGDNLMCSFEEFRDIIEGRCFQVRHIDHVHTVYPCCNRTFPMEPDMFRKCFKKITSYGQLAGFNGVSRWDRTPEANLKAFTLKFTTRKEYSASFEDMDVMYTEIETFIKNGLKNAPPGVNNFFFGTRYDFTVYDLQRALSSGTYYSIGLSLAVAFVVMLFTSLNIFITIYAIVTISLTIASTVGTLVLLGWELNILESVTISLAVGLSIDFAIHYGVAYRLSKETSRAKRVGESFRHVGPAVFMAALTTFLAGAVLIPAHIQPYKRLSTFLMLVMAFSWLFATFFFQSLCRIIGPMGNIGQIPSPFQCCKNPNMYELPETPSQLDLIGVENPVSDIALNTKYSDGLEFDASQPATFTRMNGKVV